MISLSNGNEKISDKAKIKELAAFYRKHLLEDIMPFWETRTEDREAGGYLTCFDRVGNITGTDKYIWMQGRQLWTFSALYNQVEKKVSWLDLAKSGYDFIINHAYAGNGRWNYQLDRYGQTKQGTISIFTDEFVLAGLCEYAVASGDASDYDLIKATYDTMECNVYDPDFKDIFHGTWSPLYKRHGLYMCSLNTACIARKVLGADYTRPLIDHCLEQILYVFSKDEYELLFESVSRDGSFDDSDEGRVINPGHALESMWFCIEEGKARNDRNIISRAVKVSNWMYEYGYDKQYGGIYSFMDSSGAEPKQMDWHRETNMLWHDKNWWVHSEALYTLALCAVEARAPLFFDKFLDLHNWCQKNFYDKEYGEWYPTLWRDGRPKEDYKGSEWKAAYHLPRALMMTMKLFEQQSL